MQTQPQYEVGGGRGQWDLEGGQGKDAGGISGVAGREEDGLFTVFVIILDIG
jgi:hypothetical protein